ncbi:porin [Paraburkholderia fungorum]|uniref:porin n=1 Tax=Paraburkholderia fungorum TaxID=134537 RepID=UPI0038BCA36A
MKARLYSGILLLASTAATVAQAQGSVTLYGILDTGVLYSSNQGGHSAVSQASSISRGDRWGLVGVEDLGGGFKSIFRLESGFSVSNGTLGQSSATAQRIFGRYAYVGLANSQVQVIAGRQTDFMLDFLQNTANLWFGTALEFHPAINPNFFGNNGSNPSLDRVAGAEVDNSVKLTYSPLQSVRLGAMYGFGDAPGFGSPGSTQSYGGSWSNQMFYAAAAYAARKDNLTSGTLKTLGVGGTAKLGAFTLNTMYTKSKWTLTGDTADIVDAGINYALSSAATIGLAYTYLGKNHGPSNVFYASVRNQYGVVGNYYLSKSTGIYAGYVLQHASGHKPAQIFGNSPSSSSTQGVATLGIWHAF